MCFWRVIVRGQSSKYIESSSASKLLRNVHFEIMCQNIGKVDVADTLQIYKNEKCNIKISDNCNRKIRKTLDVICNNKYRIKYNIEGFIFLTFFS